MLYGWEPRFESTDRERLDASLDGLGRWVPQLAYSGALDAGAVAALLPGGAPDPRPDAPPAAPPD